MMWTVQEKLDLGTYIEKRKMYKIYYYAIYWNFLIKDHSSGKCPYVDTTNMFSGPPQSKPRLLNSCGLGKKVARI